MELVIKLYSEKASKIGIKFPNEYTAIRAYEEIFRKNEGDVFSMKLELVKNRINLGLISEQSGGKTLYKELEYKIDQLKKMEAFLKPEMELQFVHVFSKANTLMVAKAFRTAKFIKLTHYEIVGPANFASL